MKNAIMFIIVFGVFIILAMYISGSVVNIYKESKQETKKTLPLVRCTSLLFEVEDDTIKLENNTLYFTVRNTYGDEINAFIIKTNNNSYEINLRNFVRGKTQRIKLENFSAQEFYIYPKGCPQNKKNYKIR